LFAGICSSSLTSSSSQRGLITFLTKYCEKSWNLFQGYLWRKQR
jgi:hypothetical protein